MTLLQLKSRSWYDRTTGGPFTVAFGWGGSVEFASFPQALRFYVEKPGHHITGANLDVSEEGTRDGLTEAQRGMVEVVSW